MYKSACVLSGLGQQCVYESRITQYNVSCDAPVSCDRGIKIVYFPCSICSIRTPHPPSPHHSNHCERAKCIFFFFSSFYCLFSCTHASVFSICKYFCLRKLCIKYSLRIYTTLCANVGRKYFIAFYAWHTHTIDSRRFVWKEFSIGTTEKTITASTVCSSCWTRSVVRMHRRCSIFVCAT